MELLLTWLQLPALLMQLLHTVNLILVSCVFVYKIDKQPPLTIFNMEVQKGVRLSVSGNSQKTCNKLYEFHLCILGKVMVRLLLT